MSGSNQEKLNAIHTAAENKWKPCAAKLDALNVDVWHRVKKSADIKKTKWFQSGSNIGPKITKAKAASVKFGKDMSVSNFIAVQKSLEDLSKECKSFWGKHKDASPDSNVEKALDDYDKAAGDALKILGQIAKSIETLEQMSREAALGRGTAGLHGS